MERSRVTRYIRIAVTALSLTACALLIGLWVRSYHYRDFAIINISYSRWIHLISMHGRLSCAVATPPGAFAPGAAPKLFPGIVYHLLRQRFTEGNGSMDIPREFRPPIFNSLFFDWNKYDDGVDIVIPYCFFVFVSATFAAAPWLRRRFSLRTLLIATTLVAVVLGVTVASS
jgi:hypothetical protein